jgi:hypothetical protein
VHDLSRVSAQSTEERAVTVHDDKAELLVGFQQLTESLGVELVVTEIERCIDRLKRFKVDVNFPLLSFRGDDFATVDDKPIRRDFIVQLQTLLGRCDGGKDGQTVDTRFDVGGSTLFSFPRC